MARRSGSGDPRYRSADWRTMRSAAMARAGGRCARCGKTGGKLTAHHPIPIKDGGSFWGQRLVVLCWSCHQAAHPRQPRKKRAVTYNKADPAWNAHCQYLVREAGRGRR